ncbi:MAG: fatty acid desaturase, partial [Solimonas sp.]
MTWPLTGPEILSRHRVKQLPKRTDRHGLVYFLGHLLAQGLTGLGIWLAGTSLLVVPAVLLHGFVLALWFAPMHECTH